MMHSEGQSGSEAIILSFQALPAAEEITVTTT